ncbi:MAG TPA: hypothetical protein VFJ17_01640 [Mycobacteriales bacterium]|jgi:hypothetical protein|nr:hypothetical protein [Mycobacteriales bacterium]
MTGMSVRRRAVAGLMTATGAFGVATLCWPHAAVAQEPDVAAWWSAANLGDPAPAPPAPPDVAPGDLLVQGSNTAPSPGAPLGSAPGSAQAVAGLEFDLQPTDVVGALTLDIDGSAPPQVSVVACRATGNFSNVENGPWSRVPPYDATGCAAGVLKGSTVVFADAGTLVQDAALAVVLLPGPVDRVVFAKPGADALQVTHGGGVGSGAPSFGTGTGTGGGGGSGGAFGGAQASASGPSASGPVSTSLPPAAAAPTGTDLAPVVAQSAPASRAATTAAETSRAVAGGLSTSARRWLALLVIALEVVGFVALTRMPEAAPLPLGAAATPAGGRLRPPDRAARGIGRGRGATIGGVGRFRRERHAPAPPV